MTELAREFAIAKAKGWIPFFLAGNFGCGAHILMAIASRESNMGQALDARGLGDGGHGHGIMQIDSRSWPVFCGSPAWQDPKHNIRFGAFVLSRKIAGLAQVAGRDRLRVALAAYNAGDHPLEDYLAGLDPDRRTTGGNYSRDVLGRAQFFKDALKADHYQASL